jgi:3-oxoadipate enol-lactonase
VFVVGNPSAQFLDVLGARIMWDQMGPEAGNRAERILVLVNGFQRTRQDFRALRRRLHQADRGLVTVSLDNRGCGETVTSAEFSLQNMAHDVLEVARLAQLNHGLESCALLGISMGGMIAQVAASCTDAVSHLVLVSTTAGGVHRIWPGGVGPDQVPHVFGGWPSDPDALMTRMRSYFGSRFQKSSPLLVTSMARAVAQAGADGTSKQGAELQYRAGRFFDGTAALNALSASVRTLVVTGDEDHIIPPGNSERLAQLIPGADLKVYPGVGHLILVEEPDVFAADILEFLHNTEGVRRL